MITLNISYFVVKNAAWTRTLKPYALMYECYFKLEKKNIFKYNSRYAFGCKFIMQKYSHHVFE